MKTHITNLYGHSAKSTALIAQNMVANVASDLGFKEIGVYAYPTQTDSSSEIRKRIDGMFAAVSSEDIVIAQFPTWNSIEFDALLIDKLFAYRDIKIGIFIHDVMPLMFENNYYLMPKFIALCNKAKVVIVPTSAMAERLKVEGLNVDKIVVQFLWDHVSGVAYHKPVFDRVINFAGSPRRFPFVKSWQYETPLRVFAEEDANNLKNPHVSYTGWLPDDKMMLELSRGFGLAWSEEIDNQKERTYSHYNLSYKLSSYLAAGLPIIVNQDISTQQFIEENGIGLVASSLDEVNRIVQNLTPSEYQRMADNVKNISYLVKNGYFTKKLLIETVHQLLTD